MTFSWSLFPVMTILLSSAAAQSPPSSPPAEVNGIPTWEIALAVGSGTLALLLFAYAIYIIVRRNQEAEKYAEKGIT